MNTTEEEMKRAIAGLLGGRQRPKAPRPIPEAQIAELQQYFADYQKSLAGCPFKPGDLVQAKVGSRMNQDIQGQPHIVLEVFEEPIVILDCTTDMSTGEIGARYDMRVMVLNDRFYAAHAVESFMYEPYNQTNQNQPADFGGSFKDLLSDV